MKKKKRQILLIRLLKLQFASYSPPFNIIINEDSVINGHNKLLNTNTTLLSSAFDTSIVLTEVFFEVKNHI